MDRISHRPEIIRGRDTDNPVIGKASNLAPERRRFVLVVNRYQQFVRRQAIALVISVQAWSMACL